MNKEIAKLWTDALLSGEYTQTVRKLHDSRGMCCLGVLCDLAVKAEVIAEPNRRYVYDGEDAALPNSVAKWAGIKTANGGYGGSKHCLASDNDNGHTFVQIAETINAKVDEL